MTDLTYLTTDEAVEFAGLLRPHYFTSHTIRITPVKHVCVRNSPIPNYDDMTMDPQSCYWNPFHMTGGVAIRQLNFNIPVLHVREYWDINENMDLLLERRPRVRGIFRKIVQHYMVTARCVLEKNMLAVYTDVILTDPSGPGLLKVYTNRVFIIAWNPPAVGPDGKEIPDDVKKKCHRVMVSTLHNEHGCFVDPAEVHCLGYTSPETPGAVEIVPIVLALRPPEEPLGPDLGDREIVQYSINSLNLVMGWVIPEWRSMVTTDIVDSKSDALVTSAIWPHIDDEFFGGGLLNQNQ